MIAAWRTMPPAQRDDTNITMFVVSGTDIGALVERNGRLALPDENLTEQFKRSSGGLTEIVPQDYDVFVMVGLQHGFRLLGGLMRRFGTLALSKGRNDVQILSSSCLDVCIDGLLQKTIAVKISALLASVTNKPRILMPTPCRTERELEERESALLPLRNSGELGGFYERYISRSHALGKKHAFSVLDQNPRTMIQGGGYTLNKYARGGVKYGRSEIRAKAAPDDTTHMNADYGRIALIDLVGATKRI